MGNSRSGGRQRQEPRDSQAELNRCELFPNIDPRELFPSIDPSG